MMDATPLTRRDVLAGSTRLLGLPFTVRHFWVRPSPDDPRSGSSFLAKALELALLCFALLSRIDGHTLLRRWPRNGWLSHIGFTPQALCPHRKERR